MNVQHKKSEKQLANEKADRIMQGVADWQYELRFIAVILKDLLKII